jgi:RNA polymerase sigma factor (sigma-70 family)
MHLPACGNWPHSRGAAGRYHFGSENPRLHPAVSSADLDILSCLFAEAQSDLSAFVSRRVGAQDAADVLQDTWLKLHEHGDTASWREPRAVLFTTAGNLAVDHWRQQQRHALHFDGGELPEIACPFPGPETVVDDRRQAERLATVLDELSAECRQAFLLNRLDGMTHREIADRLGICTKTVQRHIERALGHCLVRLTD